MCVLIVIFSLLYFFFFKQKTAYEMRISDWSSDVCSSDLGKADRAYGRGQQLEDTTMGWRFVNPALDKAYGTESMPQTGDNVAADHGVDRADQDAFALRSQQRAAAAQASGFFAEEIIPR